MSERYFAYGSNLWIEQMIARTGPIRQGADQPRVGRLADYRLVFNMHADNGQVFANLMCPGKAVFGVVYCCSMETLLKMDACEIGYERGRARVMLENGDELNVVTYFAQSTRVGVASEPNPQYLQKILRGARQHGLPYAYIREIEALGTVKRANDKSTPQNRAGIKPAARLRRTYRLRKRGHSGLTTSDLVPAPLP